MDLQTADGSPNTTDTWEQIAHAPTGHEGKRLTVLLPEMDQQVSAE